MSFSIHCKSKCYFVLVQCLKSHENTINVCKLTNVEKLKVYKYVCKTK